jgi:hypothetical protein
MATVDLPTTAAFAAARFSLSVQVSASAYTGFFTGNRERRNHLADRLRGTLSLPPCKPVLAAEREAFILSLSSSGDLLRMGMPQRMQRRGTATGPAAVAIAAAAGARAVAITSTPGATLMAGDWFAIGGNLLTCGPGGAVANGSGQMTVPLSLPLQRPVTAGAAVELAAPTGLWELDDAGLQLDYSAPSIQGGIALALLQVVL